MLDFRRYREMDGAAALADHLAGLPDPAPGRQAVRIGFSHLTSAFRRGHHLRLALSVFQPLVENREGGLFPLPDGDLVIAATGLSDAQWSRALLRLESWLHEAEIVAPEDLILWVDLAETDRTEAARLLGAAPTAADPDDAPPVAPADGTTATPPRGQEATPPRGEETIRHRAPETVAVEAGATDGPQDGATGAPQDGASNRPRPLDATGLNRLLDRLPELDPLSVLARRPVCAVTGGAPPQLAFLWVGTDLAAAAAALDPTVSIDGAGWLARAFADRADERLLTALTAHPPARPAALSLGLSVLLGDAFEAFDSALAAAGAPRPVLVVPKADIFADTAAWFAARDLLRGQGYKLAIGGLTRTALPLVDRRALGADLLFLAADSGLEETDPEDASRLADAVREAGTARVVLTGVDRPRLRDAGSAIGIALMAGRAIRPSG